MVKRNIDFLEGFMWIGEGFIIFIVEEIKVVICNFLWEMIFGFGVYGNVYKGVLISGVEVVIKVCYIFFVFYKFIWVRMILVLELIYYLGLLRCSLVSESGVIFKL